MSSPPSLHGGRLRMAYGLPSSNLGQEVFLTTRIGRKRSFPLTVSGGTISYGNHPISVTWPTKVSSSSWLLHLSHPSFSCLRWFTWRLASSFNQQHPTVFSKEQTNNATPTFSSCAFPLHSYSPPLSARRRPLPQPGPAVLYLPLRRLSSISAFQVL